MLRLLRLLTMGQEYKPLYIIGGQYPTSE